MVFEKIFFITSVIIIIIYEKVNLSFKYFCSRFHLNKKILFLKKCSLPQNQKKMTQRINPAFFDITTDAQNATLPFPFNLLAPLKDWLLGDEFLWWCSSIPNDSTTCYKPLKMAWIINLFKFGTLPFCLFLRKRYCAENSPTMTLYTGLHGVYGFVWLLKEHVAPDRGWQVYITIPVSILISIFPLGVYWLAPYFIASTTGRVENRKEITNSNKNSKQNENDGGGDLYEASPMRRIIATLLFGIGVTIMFGADIQKYFVLRARASRGLITDGFFELCRHPNYLGEMMLYGAFALLVVKPNRARIAWAVLIAIWAIVFTTQMLQKEARMSRHEGWQEYKNSTAFVVPYLL